MHEGSSFSRESGEVITGLPPFLFSHLPSFFIPPFFLSYSIGAILIGVTYLIMLNLSFLIRACGVMHVSYCTDFFL